MLRKLTAGLHDSLLGLEQFREDVLTRLSKLAVEQPDAELDRLRAKTFEDPSLSARREQIGGELFGLDLFDVGKVTGLPGPLIDKLAWSPGEDEEFFAPGNFRGWPVRVWPRCGDRSFDLDGEFLPSTCSRCSTIFIEFSSVSSSVWPQITRRPGMSAKRRSRRRCRFGTSSDLCLARAFCGHCFIE